MRCTAGRATARILKNCCRPITRQVRAAALRQDLRQAAAGRLTPAEILVAAAEDKRIKCLKLEKADLDECLFSSSLSFSTSFYMVQSPHKNTSRSTTNIKSSSECFCPLSFRIQYMAALGLKLHSRIKGMPVNT